MRYIEYANKATRLVNKRKIMPEYVTFFVTNKCNAACEHCFYWKELNAPLEELNLNEIAKVAQSMNKFMFLLISGGEPFLRDDLDEIVKIFYNTNKVRKLSIVTNGSLPKEISRVVENIMVECPDLYLTLFVSLDEIGDNHDKIRGVKGIYKSVLETINHIKQVQSEYPRLSLGVALVYSSFNENAITDIYKHIKNTIRPDTINCAFVRGDARNSYAKTCNIGNFIELHKMIKDDLIHNKLKRVFDPIIGNIVTAYKFESISQCIRIIKKAKYIFPCYAGMINVVIYPEGNVFPCELSYEKMGSLREFGYDFKKIWYSALSEQIRRKIKKSKCYCIHGCNLLSSIMFNVRFLPKAIFNYLRLVLRV